MRCAALRLGAERCCASSAASRPWCSGMASGTAIPSPWRSRAAALAGPRHAATAARLPGSRAAAASINKSSSRRQQWQPAASSGGLSAQRCEPCEASPEALDAMGLHMLMDESTAERYREEVDARWQLVRDAQGRLHLQRALRTKNYLKALALFQLVADVCERAGHHADLHLEGWNNVRLDVWTHARDGLSENDFILAAKLDELLASDAALALLSKRQPEV